ncbi:hypothetical protein HPB51_006206 [Rhipicephalus microplus]|uniref:5MP1/2-like HEAT domain-containing protein n=1 Tax=Rhipicephalus microplus TaxID=6941 RepID=A0A9J6DLU0_RHIMP|nr:hypothetical protein HPB51_006206 [Rhipicephalus microplus]
MLLIHRLFYIRSAVKFNFIMYEKEKYDPSGFRDAILQGFAEAGSDLDAVHKFLDAAGSKLDYRRYGEVIFDILLAGGILGEWARIDVGLCLPAVPRISSGTFLAL